MKRLVALLVIILLIGIPNSGPIIRADTTLRPMFSTLKDVTLRDDAFHGHGRLPYAEWWYFDAVFDNGYSMTMGVKVFNVLGRGGVNTRVDIYHQGSRILENEKTSSMKEFYASIQIPLVAIDGKQLIQGSYNPVSGHFAYNLSYVASQGALSLHFIGCTQGWKRQQRAGDWWAVMLPRAIVSGTMTINGTTMNVTGTGYHDHNWGVCPRIALNYGWFWGTFESANYSATWAMTYPTRLTRHGMMVVSEKDGGYLDIPPETIWFSTKRPRLDHLRLIPMYLNTETMTEKVFLTVNMDVISVDHARLLGVIEYWRYHVNCSGTIMMHGHTETVEGVFIAEYLRFR
jgi:predicted secreted hydrolase